MTSYIAFHQEKGIYLGIIAGYIIFSLNNVVYTSTAIRFNTEEEIKVFFDELLPKHASEIIAVPVNTSSTGFYVDVVDILKSGHTVHTESMVEHMFTLNETLH